MKKITVIGAGSWGTALANSLAINKHDVTIYSNNKDVADEINNMHTNLNYLKDVVLDENLKATFNPENDLSNSDFILLVVPSHVMRIVVSQYKEFFNKNAIIINASKGLEIESLKTMTEVIKSELPNCFNDRIVTFSGPSHAEEVVRKMPTAIVSASKNLEAAKSVQEIFSNNFLRVYVGKDPIGVEVGGSIKNIIAIGAGMCDGLGLGDNTKAALLTRGLHEMTRFGVAIGAEVETFSGLAGIGDLIVTGTSVHSRNWRTGNALSKGKSLEETLEELGMVAEGVKTTKAIYNLSKDMDIELPITNEIYKVLFENKDPKLAIDDLMNRERKDEF